MRRRLLKAVPALSFHFGLKPWELELLTFGELDAYLDALDELNGGS